MTDTTPSTNKKARTGLGRGLSALLGDAVTEAPIGGDGAPNGGLRTLPVSALAPHPGQPRKRFDDDALDELAKSISQRGLIQPIVVRPNGHGYQIVAGERRWRAAQRAHLHEVPVVVRELDDAETMEIALVENIQRADLNAIEEAEAYARLIEQFGHTQEALGRIVNKSRSHISNLMRLLDLPGSVRAMLVEGDLEMGHARALIGVADAEGIARRIVDERLSVRDAERLARDAKPQPKGKRAAAPSADTVQPDADIAALERQLGDLLGLRVRIAHGGPGGGGTLTLGYSTLDQLDMVCQRLSGEGI